MTFENKRHFTKQVFEIKRSTLKVYIKNLFDSTEYEVSLEHINYKRKIDVLFNHNALVCSLFCFAIGFLLALADNELATIVFLFISIVCFFSAIFTKKKVVTIQTYDGNTIQLYFNNSNKDIVVGYADQIIQSSNNYLFRKYSKVDPALPIESQINNLLFLKDREIISEEEYESFKNQLLGRTKKTAIGF